MKIKKITLLHACLLFSSFLLHAQYNFELIKDINPNGDSNPGKFTYFNSKLIFTADDGVHGREPWISDGTNAGTFMLKDINPNGDTTPTQFYECNGKVYFNADDGVNSGLWVTDGTTVGTQFLKNVYISIDIFSTSAIVFNELLYFSGTDSTSDTELWVTDGTTVGTQLVKDLYSSISSNPLDFEVLNGNLYFSARNPQTSSIALWISDGTTLGTTVLSNAPIEPFELTAFGGKIYFSAQNNSNGIELWSTDGTTAGTQLLKDIYPGTESSRPFNFKVFNNKLFFIANDGAVGKELWVTDGTTAGTVLFSNLLTPGDSNPEEFTVVNNLLFFRANGTTVGEELFATYGVSGNLNTFLVKDILPFAGSSKPRFLNEYNNELIFTADETAIFAYDLWVSNGTQPGTIKISPPIAPNVGPLTDNGRNFTKVNNSLFFTASFNSNGNELWKLTATNLSTSEFDLLNELKVYPNPTDDLVTIQFQNDFKGSYSLFNQLGKQILTHTINSLETQISLEKCTSGMYLLVLSSDNGEQIQTYKILKK
ncbi:T9SS type A sorting domain-containing protein [Flavobacterium jejuense]|uniref:T9SS type A sorting domain-containing protein n=1 Tax=Flavobacterium jejuense TaxID=1544455 RepID=A0ABX0IQV9_9FLAO|nr:ELWxxDGT repeat protein [Flavobacterium jejuense]NHN24279.1 T9SS type A sorting domain-containing protein [Flavobacterium jejuense]